MDFLDAQRPLYETKANLFKGLAHPVRLRVLEILTERGEASVGELLSDMRLEQSHLSQHLSVLRQYHLVVADRRGSSMYYRLAHAQVAELMRISRALLVELLEDTRQQLESSLQAPTLTGARA